MSNFINFILKFVTKKDIFIVISLHARMTSERRCCIRMNRSYTVLHIAVKDYIRKIARYCAIWLETILAMLGVRINKLINPYTQVLCKH